MRSFIIIFSTTYMSDIQLKITRMHKRGSKGHSIPCSGQLFFTPKRTEGYNKWFRVVIGNTGHTSDANLL